MTGTLRKKGFLVTTIEGVNEMDWNTLKNLPYPEKDKARKEHADILAAGAAKHMDGWEFRKTVVKDGRNVVQGTNITSWGDSAHLVRKSDSMIVTVSLPNYGSNGRFSIGSEGKTITVAFNKPCKAVAREIMNRLLPEAEKRRAEEAAKKKREQDYADKVEAAKVRILDACPNVKRTVHSDNLQVACEDGWVHDFRVNDTTASLELYSMPIDVIIDVLKVLHKHDVRNAKKGKKKHAHDHD